MIPLSDENPVRQVPLVTWGIIGLCILVFLWQLSLSEKAMTGLFLAYGVVPAHLFDLYYDATLGRDDLLAFMERENPAALKAMQDRFAALRDAGLWVTRRNSISAKMDAAE